MQMLQTTLNMHKTRVTPLITVHSVNQLDTTQYEGRKGTSLEQKLYSKYVHKLQIFTYKKLTFHRNFTHVWTWFINLLVCFLHWIIFFFLRLIYLFEGQRYKAMEIRFICWFTPKGLPRQSQEPWTPSTPPLRTAEAQVHGSFSAVFPNTTVGSWSQSGASRSWPGAHIGCWCC